MICLSSTMKTVLYHCLPHCLKYLPFHKELHVQLSTLHFQLFFKMLSFVFEAYPRKNTAIPYKLLGFFTQF